MSASSRLVVAGAVEVDHRSLRRKQIRLEQEFGSLYLGVAVRSVTTHLDSFFILFPSPYRLCAPDSDTPVQFRRLVGYTG